MCNIQPKDPRVTKSKFIVDFELQFSCAKRDLKNFYCRLLRNGTGFDECFPYHTIFYVPVS